MSGTDSTPVANVITRWDLSRLKSYQYLDPIQSVLLTPISLELVGFILSWSLNLEVFSFSLRNFHSRSWLQWSLQCLQIPLQSSAYKLIPSQLRLLPIGELDIISSIPGKNVSSDHIRAGGSHLYTPLLSTYSNILTILSLKEVNKEFQSAP